MGLGSPVRGGALVGYPREAQAGEQCPSGLGAASAPANPPSCLSAPRNRPEGKVLETVGVFEAPKQHGKYETGQVGGSGGGTADPAGSCHWDWAVEGFPLRKISAAESQEFHSSVLLVCAVSAVCQSSDNSRLIRICSTTQLLDNGICSTGLVLGFPPSGIQRDNH